MGETIIKIDHISKEYRLGAIGGGTLKGDLQSLAARIRGKEDPNRQIGQNVYAKNERFLALDDVSFSVEKGDRVGIIGHNGAGKSTLLKLLSRVTAPTKGTISFNGRIASMLEVGTGFHPELTGRENVYLNGAILGMTKAEITAKFDDIVKFAEMEKFIDTPVKRYSSGMYVKLAFAVAAHLDSEILVMDEVLAVGDMKFQQKCLGKMDDVSKNEGRTVLYVSHNMNTIRQLCNRCVVLDHGKVIFDGDVEEAISIYMGATKTIQNHYVYSKPYHSDARSNGNFYISSLTVHGVDGNGRIPLGGEVVFDFMCHSMWKYSQVKFRFEIEYKDGTKAGTMLSDKGINFEPGDKRVRMIFSAEHLTPGYYQMNIIAYINNEYGAENFLDGVYPGAFIEIENELSENNQLIWMHQYWGHIRLNDAIVCDSDSIN